MHVSLKRTEGVYSAAKHTSGFSLIATGGAAATGMLVGEAKVMIAATMGASIVEEAADAVWVSVGSRWRFP